MRYFIFILFILLAVAAFAEEKEPQRLDNPQGIGNVRDSVRTLSDRILFHKHDGTDGSSNLENPYILGSIILQSPNGNCWSCGPDNSGVWTSTPTACP